MSSGIASCFKSGIRKALLGSSILLLAGCQQEQAAQPASRDAAMDWAHAALERNPQLELVATDPEAQVFTVRHRQTGDVQVVKLDELAAAPVAQLAKREPAAAPRAEDSTAMPQTAESAPADEPIEQAARTDTAGQTRAGADARAQQATAAPEPAANYTIERSDGQVRVTGPGVSIVSSGAESRGHEGVSHSNSVEPIICEGQRMVHLDGRQIFVDGDAITVRGGCELYITNSRVVATGTGVVVLDGTVHVSNSTIDGQNGSFDVGDEARLFARSSTFRGIPRRSENALVQDQGGNRWR